MQEYSGPCAQFIKQKTEELVSSASSHCYNDEKAAKAHAVKLYIAAYLLDGKCLDSFGNLYTPGMYHHGDMFLMNTKNSK